MTTHSQLTTGVFSLGGTYVRSLRVHTQVSSRAHARTHTRKIWEHSAVLHFAMAVAAPAERQAYVTLFSGSPRGPAFDGLRVLAHTIRQHDSLRPLMAMVSGADANVTAAAIVCELGSTHGVRALTVPLITSSN